MIQIFSQQKIYIHTYIVRYIYHFSFSEITKKRPSRVPPQKTTSTERVSRFKKQKNKNTSKN